MRVIVVGCGGFIGIPFCAELVRRGHYVCGIDRFFFGKYPSCDCIVRDIRSVEDVDFSTTDVVVDLAGLSNDATAEIDPKLTIDINANGGARMVKLAREAGVRRYIYSSSASVYGHGEKTGLSETDPVNPLTLYAKSKLHVEAYLNSFIYDSLETVILRNATVYGVSKRMRFDLAVNLMTMRAWKDGVINIEGGGEQKRPFIHIDDLVSIMAAMVELPAEKVAGQIFNVGYDAMNFSINEIANMVKLEFPSAKINRIGDAPDKRDYSLSFNKLADTTGFYFGRDIRTGIREIRTALEAGTIKADDATTHTLNWYKSLLDWDKRLADIRIDGRIL